MPHNTISRLCWAEIMRLDPSRDVGNIFVTTSVTYMDSA
jgi:hypothetical protein